MNDVHRCTHETGDRVDGVAFSNMCTYACYVERVRENRQDREGRVTGNAINGVGLLRENPIGSSAAMVDIPLDTRFSRINSITVFDYRPVTIHDPTV